MDAKALARKGLVPMNVLHLLSNHRWTERAEPAADLAVAQKKLGAHVVFACGRSEGDLIIENTVEYQVQQKGLSPLLLELPKHFKLGAAWRDVPLLRKIINEEKIHIVHCHMENAHLMACLARRRKSKFIIIMNCYDPDGPEKGLRSWYCHKFGTRGLVTVSDRSKQRAIEKFGFRPDSVCLIEPGIDLARFDPLKHVEGDRISFGLNESDFVVGMVTRIRQERRLDVAIDAVGRLASEIPELRLFIVGRGKDVPGVILKPAERKGVRDKVVLAGYCRGDKLVSAYRAMDALFYAVPGTDKSCRTVREAMGSGIPVIASKTGILPELVDDNVNGRLVDLSAISLAEVISDLYKNRMRLKELGESALITARKRFASETSAQKALKFYENLIK